MRFDETIVLSEKLNCFNTLKLQPSFHAYIWDLFFEIDISFYFDA